MANVIVLDVHRTRLAPSPPARPANEAAMIYAFGDHELDTDTFELRSGDSVSKLEPQVFDVLALLVAHRDRVVTKEELLDEVWGDRFVSESALTSRIRDARRAVGDDGQRQSVIQTVHGRGYRFVARVDERPTGAAVVTSAAEVAATAGPPRVHTPARPPRTRYARSGDYSIAYQVVGEGPSDLVFIPGFVSNVELQWEHEQMASFFSTLASFSRLIIFDKRGTGLSDRVPIDRTPTLEERMDDVRAVMDAAGSERATLFGISEGGAMAVLFAATFPERVERLVLANSYARPFSDDIPGLAQLTREYWGTSGVFAVLAPSWTDREQRRFLARYERHSATPATAAHLIEILEDLDVRPVLPTIGAPTRVIHRRDDDVVPLACGEELAAAIPGADLVVVDGRDHFVMVDQQPILESVQEFVTGSPAAPEPDRVLTTVLFVDVVDSTANATRLGDRAWSELLSRFYETVRAAVREHRGSEIVTTGDGMLATFDGPARAVRCGQAIQSTVCDLGVAVRVGVHTAEVERLGDDIAGVGVHIGARVTAAASPQEVWVTRTVRDLVAGSGIQFAPRGQHRFKGVSEDWDLYAAVA